MGGMSIWSWLIVVVLLYWVPTVVAYWRHHHNRLAILVLNTFLGWTFLGWVAALIWASTRVERNRVEQPPSKAVRREPTMGDAPDQP